jgi:hypothetical protein
MKKILVENVEKHLRVLTEEIGVRLAGSAGERCAAEYIAQHLGSFCDTVQVDEFDVNERVVDKQLLEVCVDGHWQRFPCSPLSSTCGTDGKTIEAPLVFFSPQNDYLRDDLSYLCGKAVVSLNSFFDKQEQYRRMMEAKPAFLIFVDARYPDDALRADGMIPLYTRTYGAMTVVNVPYLDVWRWKEQTASAARLCVAGVMKPGTSQNVIAELLGSDPDAGLLIVGGHHDTQADSVGADDNGTGVAAVLELAGALADIPRRRTIRLISFGSEEQLSVGSSAYVRRYRQELADKAKFMMNFDSYGSLLGWSEWSCCGPNDMGRYLSGFFAGHGEYVSVSKEAIPLADHFPFAACGIPCAWLGRMNCTSGRFFHHRPDDTIIRVDIPLVTRHLNVSAACLAELAVQDVLPFGESIPCNQAEEIEKTWRELFGGWTGPGTF